MQEVPHSAQPPVDGHPPPGQSLAQALEDLIEERESVSPDAEPIGPDNPCHEPGEWICLVLGEYSPSDASSMLSHAALCAPCATKLRQALQVQSPSFSSAESSELAALLPAVIAGQSRLANVLARTPYRSRRSARPRLFISGLAAACLLVGAVLSGYQWWQRRVSAERLLAAVYGRDRVFDLRVPGAAYSPVSPVRHQRGGTSESEPADLLAARASIARHLERSPQDPRWLLLQARADTLEENFDSAIDILDRLISAGPVTPGLLGDAATAYFQRGLSTGSQNDRATALDYLSRADELAPGDPVILFNEAVVMEERGQVINSVATWNRFLRFEKDPHWLGEGRRRLADLEQKLNRIKTHQSRVEQHLASPASMRALATDDAALAAVDEELSSIFLPKILVLAYPAPPDRSRGSPCRDACLAARTLLHALAASLERHHQDPWLTRLLPSESATPSATFLQAVQLLGEAIDADTLADYPTAQRNAEQSLSLFRSLGNSAGEDRAELEYSYALQRASQFQECRRWAKEALGGDREFAWIQISAALEEGICNTGPGTADEDRPVFNRILAAARNHSYSLLELRTWTTTGGAASESGDAEEAWRIDLEGVHRFYSGDYPALRLMNLMAGPVIVEQDTPRVHLEILLEQELLSTLELTASRNEVPAARMWLAVTATRAGNVALAEQQMRLARSEQQALGNVASMESPTVESEIALANLYLDRGDNSGAAAQLRAADSLLAHDDNFYNRRAYAAASGRLKLKQGNPDAAEATVREAILEEERQALHVGSGNVHFALGNRDLYAVLVAVWLAENRPAEDVLALWERYRLRILGNPVPVCSNQRLDCLTPQVTEALHRLGPNHLIGQILLSDHLFLYEASSSGVRWRSAPFFETDVLFAARDLERVASSPTTSRPSIDQAARRVGDLLLPSSIGLPADPAQILIESDPVLGNLPWPAVEAAGSPIGLQFNIEEAPSLLLTTYPGKTGSQSGSELVIGASVASGSYAPLPEALNEAREVSRFVNTPRLLLASGATEPQVADAITSAEAIHFAGHAVQNRGATRLLLAAGSSSDGKPYLDSELLRKHPPRAARLAVFSACSTGKREESWNHDMEDIVDTLAALGVPEVVATRWQIDSGTAVPMMDAFYGGLAQGFTVSRALKDARLSLSRDPRYWHPYFWAAYYASGTGATDLSEVIHGVNR